LALGPLVIIYAGRSWLGNSFTVAFLLFYYFIFKPTLDIQRLLSLNKIDEKDAWKFFVPFAIDQMKFNRSLWLD
jgi:hypothetical protein